MKSVNIQRTESLLMELVPEALSDLNDSRINALSITAIDCKNGKYDATVYFDGSDYTPSEIKEIIGLLIKANGRIRSHVLAATSWYKCPNFKFVKDDSLEEIKKIDKIFDEIAKGTKNG